MLTGHRIGVYEVEALLGAGGMGEVYRARDTKLGRDVAIKILPPIFTSDPERLTRFEREARMLASLNHPNIGAIYGFEESDGVRALVLELVEGLTLADRLASGPIALAESLGIARQIADAVDAAHERGIVHRDLKPANIKITPDGVVKVLDFGLAKAATGDGGGSDLSRSPTVTIGGTREGVILGTAAYMSPEQARGQPVDKRTDIWAFGCLLYEMLTGRIAFAGETVSDTIAAILDHEPDWSRLPESTPANIHHLLQRCLDKDPKRRRRDIREARIELDGSGAVPVEVKTPAERSLFRQRAPWVLAAATLVIGFALAAFWPMPSSEPPLLTPFAGESELQLMPQWSPKGDRIAYVAAVDNVLQIFTKSLGSSARTQITHENESCLSPIWSPEGTRIFFLTGRIPGMSLRSIAVAGGGSEKVLDGVYRADLSRDGKILAVLVRDAPGNYRLAFSSPPGAPPTPYAQAPLSAFRNTGTLTALQFDDSGRYLGLYTSAGSTTQFWRIPTSGGSPEEMLGGRRQDAAGHFTWLKNGAGFIADSFISTSFHLQAIEFASGRGRILTTGALHDIMPALAANGSTVAYVSGEVGYDIIQVPLDGSGPRDVVATVRNELSPVWARDGVRFAYVTDRNDRPELWLRNQTDGSEQLIAGPGERPGVSMLFDSDISPDGGRVAYRAQGGAEATIWISPLSGEPPVRLWDDPARSPQRGPSWSPDGNWIAYYGLREGRAAVMKARVAADAPAEFLAYMARNQPVRWSPRGDWIAFRDGATLRIVSPDGKQNRAISQHVWETYGWSKDGAAVLGISIILHGEHRRLVLERLDISTGKDTQIADLGAVPAAFDFAEDPSQFSYRGFSLHPDGKSFLTAMFRAKTQIYLMKDFDGTVRLAGRWWKRP